MAPLPPPIYNSGSNYNYGDIVQYPNNSSPYYTSIVIGTNTVKTPDTNPSAWLQTNRWTSGSTYAIGDKVFFNNTDNVTYYSIISSNIGNAPYATNSTAWIPFWTANSSYVSGNQVYFNGSYYTANNAISGSSGNQYPNIDTTNWTVVSNTPNITATFYNIVIAN